MDLVYIKVCLWLSFRGIFSFFLVWGERLEYSWLLVVIFDGLVEVDCFEFLVWLFIEFFFFDCVIFDFMIFEFLILFFFILYVVLLFLLFFLYFVFFWVKEDNFFFIIGIGNFGFKSESFFFIKGVLIFLLGFCFKFVLGDGRSRFKFGWLFAILFLFGEELVDFDFSDKVIWLVVNGRFVILRCFYGDLLVVFC